MKKRNLKNEDTLLNPLGKKILNDQSVGVFPTKIEVEGSSCSKTKMNSFKEGFISELYCSGGMYQISSPGFSHPHRHRDAHHRSAIPTNRPFIPHSILSFRVDEQRNWCENACLHIQEN